MFSAQSLGAWAVAGALFYATLPRKGKVVIFPTPFFHTNITAFQYMRTPPTFILLVPPRRRRVEYQKITRTRTSEYIIMRPDTCTYIQEMSKKDIEDANRENLAKLATKKPEQQ